MTKEQIQSFKEKMETIGDFATDVLETINAHKTFAKKKHKSIESVFSSESIEFFLGKVKYLNDIGYAAQRQLESIQVLSNAN